MNLFSLSLLLEAYAIVQVRKLFTEKVIYCGLTQNLFYNKDESNQVLPESEVKLIKSRNNVIIVYIWLYI